MLFGGRAPQMNGNSTWEVRNICHASVSAPQSQTEHWHWSEITINHLYITLAAHKFYLIVLGLPFAIRTAILQTVSFKAGVIHQAGLIFNPRWLKHLSAWVNVDKAVRRRRKGSAQEGGRMATQQPPIPSKYDEYHSPPSLCLWETVGHSGISNRTRHTVISPFNGCVSVTISRLYVLS